VRRSAARAATRASCQREWRSVQPRVSAVGEWKKFMGISRLRGGTISTFAWGLRLKGVEKAPDLGEFIGGGASGGEGLENEVRGRAGEGLVEKFANDLALGGFGGAGGGEDVGAGGAVAGDEALVGHDLEELEGGSIGRQGALAGEMVVDLADGGGAEFPEDAEDGEFAVGGWRGRFGHGRTPFLKGYTKVFVASTKKFVDCGRCGVNRELSTNEQRGRKLATETGIGHK
jgi:hypothetical protein